MSKLADTEVIKWQHECTNKHGKKIIRQIIGSLFCGTCGWEHEE